MNCPYCGGAMERGHITGKSILRVVPEENTHKVMHYYTPEDLQQSYQKTNLVGWPLNIPYAGLAPQLPANYCLKCRKVICEIDILEYEEERV